MLLSVSPSNHDPNAPSISPWMVTSEAPHLSPNSSDSIPPMELEYILANKECRHGTCMPPGAWAKYDAEQQKLAEEREVEYKHKELHLLAGKLVNGLPTDEKYELISLTDSNGVDVPVERLRLMEGSQKLKAEFKSHYNGLFKDWTHVWVIKKYFKFPEKPVVESTHPTVLTWLVRFVELEDILYIFKMLSAENRRDYLKGQAHSLEHALDIISRVYDTTLRRMPEKYKDADKPPYMSDLVTPIIK